MPQLPEPLERLIQELSRLPGIGPKTAQRLAFHLLRTDSQRAASLAQAIEDVKARIGYCERCYNIAEGSLCWICLSPRRDATLLCVVESPLDVLAIERTSEFSGLYFVLQGVISPIDGIGPERLRIRELLTRVEEAFAAGEAFEEVILATNPTLEGEATAMFLDERLDGRVGSVTRIARGIPVGGDLEYADEVTLIRALQGRRAIRA